jgi:polysaccharide export outer membrane protein
MQISISKSEEQSMIGSKRFIIACGALLLGGRAASLQAQAVQGTPVPNLVTANATALAPGGSRSSGPQLVPRYPRYVIRREDVLRLTFPLTPELNQTVTVQPDGFISLQNAGSVHVQGLTIPQLLDALRAAYAGTLHNPIIEADLTDFEKPFFTVSGQVGKPGKYELRSDITIAEALAVAGGMTPEAKTQVFLFHHTASGWVETRKVNMKDILSGKRDTKKDTEDASIKPGDIIYVPEKFIANFKKYVPYSLAGGTYLSPIP